MAKTAKKTAPAAKKAAASPKADRVDQPIAQASGESTPSQEQIARLAYTMWEESGRRDGEAEANWARAERELRGLGPQQPAR